MEITSTAPDCNAKELPDHILCVCTLYILDRADRQMTLYAEIPDPTVDPELHEITMSHMVHGPCGSINPESSCMEDGFCTKNYSKVFVSETQSGADSYPLEVP